MVDVCRQIGVSEATYYTWKKKFGDLGVSELKRLKMLEDENTRLKRIVANLQERFKINVRRSCRLALLRPSVWYAKSEARDQSALRLRIREIAMDRPRFGYLRVLVMLKREG